MLTRRRFLNIGFAGLAATAAGCHPADLAWENNPVNRTLASHPALVGKAALADKKRLFLGYPINMNSPPEEFFAWRRELRTAGIGSFAYNNVGNPYRPSAIPFNTHDLERETILAFGKLLGFEPDNIWGFLSHSGTDSNMHGMYMGRTLLKGRTGLLPKCYFTKEAHYSIQILRDLLGLEGVLVRTHSDSGMDTDHLAQTLAENVQYPALVVATAGTTFKGGIDNVELIRKVLGKHPSFLHLDAALFGGYLPYTEHRGIVAHHSEDNPTQNRYDSIAVSCHKFFGFPAPAGLFVTRGKVFEEFNELYGRIHNPEYIGHVPGTITCSRDAVKPAEFRYFSTDHAMKKLAADAQAILSGTQYLLSEMQNNFSDLQPRRSSEYSNTLYFRKPGDWLVHKYSLATMHLSDGRSTQDYAHVVVMPHADRQVLEEFLSDLEKLRRVS
jgi:histidine decarboxylase